MHIMQVGSVSPLKMTCNYNSASGVFAAQSVQQEQLLHPTSGGGSDCASNVYNSLKKMKSNILQPTKNKIHKIFIKLFYTVWQNLTCV